MVQTTPHYVWGGVYIALSGSKALTDMATGTAMSLNLADETMATLATLYINLYPTVSTFNLTKVTIGYVDGANADDLADVHLLEGPHATDWIQQRKCFYSSGATAETPLSGGPDIDLVSPSLAHLDTAGKVYFLTNWTTAVIDCGAAEYFFLKIEGEEARYHYVA